MKKSPLASILSIVFIDLIGFGMIIPILPLYAQRFQATEWQIGILLVLKRFYRYLKEERSLAVLDPEEIRTPRRPRKEVAYLTAEEVERFVSIIKISNHRGYSYVAGLRFRALVETILGSAMRISEVLSLNRNQIDFKRAQATIIGKGRKERTVFFTERALFWIERYLDTRADTCSALFVCQDGRARLKRTDICMPSRATSVGGGDQQDRNSAKRSPIVSRS